MQKTIETIQALRLKGAPVTATAINAIAKGIDSQRSWRFSHSILTLLAMVIVNGEGKTNSRGRGRREKKRNASRQTAVKREKFFELAASGGR